MKCLSDLVIQGLPQDDEWELKEPLIWDLGNAILTVPAGFITDLASIPRVFQNVLSVTGKSRRAAVGHDWLYCTHQWSRANSDEFLRLALIAEGMSEFEARIYWLGVRSGGWHPWGKRDGLQPDDFINGKIP